jgi:crossover junction endodeoxyribonuclease RuvC
MRILALDLASCTGWACGSTSEGVLEHSSYQLPKTGEDVGMFLAYFRKWLESTIARNRPGELIFESPILPRKTNIITLRKLYSLAGRTEEIAYDLHLKCREENIGKICTHFLGRGYPAKGEPRKRATMTQCRARGWTVKDDNDADALALLDYALALEQPNRALDATPLFGGLRP